MFKNLDHYTTTGSPLKFFINYYTNIAGFHVIAANIDRIFCKKVDSALKVEEVVFETDLINQRILSDPTAMLVANNLQRI